MLLHGLGAAAESWALQIPPLVSNGFRVIVPDARGFGKSSFPGKTSIACMSKDYTALLDNLGIYALNLVGLSMGGAVALQFALDFPARINSLVLVNTFDRLRPDSPSEFFYFFIRMILVHTVGISRQAQVVAKRIFPDPDQSDYRAALIDQILQANPKAYRSAMRALAFHNVTARLKELPPNVLIITGENDTTIPSSKQKIMAGKIRGAKHAIIPGAGHAVTIDQPGPFNQLLIKFLNGVKHDNRHLFT